ncbi:MAG: sulfite exporter TauE/SafE family protein [Bradymonadaceae bacterium]
MDDVSTLGIFFMSMAAGGLGSMCGLGGGIFLVPLFSVLLGVPLKIAIAASAVSVVVNSLTGAGIYLRQKMVNVRLTLALQITTAIGALIGGLLVVFAPERVLQFVFAVILYVMIFIMLRPTPIIEADDGSTDPYGFRGTYFDPSLSETVSYFPVRIRLGMFLSGIAGFISGMLGVGGGPIKVPLMNGVMRLPVKAAVASSTYMVGMTASVSALIYYSSGLVDTRVAVPAVMGILLGAQVGSRLGTRAPAMLIRRVLIVILIVLATVMFVEALGLF